MKMMMNELALQVISFKGCDQAGTTYRHRAPKRIKMLKWNRCDMPKAKQRKMHITPVLPPNVALAVVYDLNSIQRSNIQPLCVQKTSP